MPSGMGEDVLFVPALKIKLDAGGQESEAGFGELEAAFAPEHPIQMALDVVQVEHVGRSVIELRVGDLFGAPVGALLLLVHIDVEQLAGEVLEPVSVGVGADQPARDLGAPDGTRDETEA